MATKVTRIRVELRGDTVDEVQDQLVNEVGVQRDLYGGKWAIEDKATMPAKNGHWGRITIRRTDAGSLDPLSEGQ